MRLTLDLDDDAYEALKKQAGKDTVQHEIKRRLKLVEATDKGDRVVILHGDERRELEKLFQTTVESARQIVREFNNLSILKIGTIERGFTAGELVRLESQANFHGMDRAAYLKMISEDGLNYAQGQY